MRCRSKKVSFVVGSERVHSVADTVVGQTRRKRQLVWSSVVVFWLNMTAAFLASWFARNKAAGEFSRCICTKELL